MRMVGKKRAAILDWGLLIGLTAAAVLVAEVGGLRAEWEDAIVLTVIVFTIPITSFRSAWGLAAFWKNVALLFAAHSLVVLVVLQILPERRFGVPKLLLTVVGVAETVLIGTVLWKKTRPTKGD